MRIVLENPGWNPGFGGLAVLRAAWREEEPCSRGKGANKRRAEETRVVVRRGLGATGWRAVE